MQETVRRVAQRIAKLHMLSRKEKEAMISSIPNRVLNVSLSVANLHELGDEIDEIRFKKEDEFAKLLKLNISKKGHRVSDKEIFYNIINFPENNGLDFRKKQIHFLFSVAATIIHY